MLGIPITCKEPQKAVDVLSLLYTDPDFINLIDWGIEGKHYVKIPGYDNMITFPQGVNFDNSRWDMNAGWIFGNQLASYIWEGNPPDLYAELDSFNKNALNSKAMGFRYDSTSVKTAVAAVNNVIEEYRLGLEFGVVDPEVNLPRFIQALKNAGIDEIVAEKQRQLDAWAAVNAK
jgi:putative aldouronate transport system substrate-binding protein